MKSIYALAVILFVMFFVSLALLPIVVSSQTNETNPEEPTAASQYIGNLTSSDTSGILEVTFNAIVDSLHDNLRIMLVTVAVGTLAGYTMGVTAGFIIPLVMLIALGNLMLAPTQALLVQLGITQPVMTIFTAVVNFLIILSIIAFASGRGD